jgi:hypothetical protein
MASILGGALGAFANNSVSPIQYNRQATKNLNWLGKQFQGDNTDYMSALNAFRGANTATIGRVRDAANQAYNDYQNLYDRNLTYDPIGEYERLRSGNLSALKDWSGALEGAGSRQDKLALAAMGMGGRPDSSYSTALRADRVSRNIAPVLGNIMSSLGSDVVNLGNQRAQNLSNLATLIGLRTETPMMGYGLELDPANALAAIRGNQIGQIGDVVDVAKNNTAGFQQKTDTLGKISNSLNAANDALWQNVGNAMSVYSSLYGGGMLGGMGGGLGGLMGGMGGGGGGISTGSRPAGSNTFSIGAGGAAPSPYAGTYAPNYGAPQQYNPWANYSGYA